MGAGLETVLSGLQRRMLPVVNQAHVTLWVEIGDAAGGRYGRRRARSAGSVHKVVDDQPSPMADLF